MNYEKMTRAELITEIKSLSSKLKDITGRKKVEKEIHKLAHAVEQSYSTVVITDAKGNIEYVNPRFTQLTGYTAEEAIGKNPRILKTDKTPPEEYKRLWKTITSGSEWRGEFCNKKKNGELYWEFVSISPVKNKEGVITNFIAVKEDITRCKKAEKLLKAQYLVTQVLAESITPEDAFSKILETICTALEWDIGEIWMIDQQEKVLRNTVIWHIPSLKIPEFKAITRQMAFPLQSGLPGRVWKSAKPLWIEDVVSDTNFRRASVAAKEGVHGAFGFPIMSGSEVLGIINFFSLELKHPDKYLLDMMSAIGIRIGFFIKRKRTEELLHMQKAALEQKNIALSEILGQIEIEKKQIKDNVIANAENLLLPIIQKLRLTGESRKYVQLLQKNLQELTSAFGTRLTEKEIRLTSREIEICNMIKNGLTNKEISGLLNISHGTTERHRANIRKKLGVINKDINLHSFLRTL
jgi:PAS domain S-box-containing protein